MTGTPLSLGKDTRYIKVYFQGILDTLYCCTTQQSGQQLLSFLINKDDLIHKLIMYHKPEKFAWGKIGYCSFADNVFDFEEEVEDKAIKKNLLNC